MLGIFGEKQEVDKRWFDFLTHLINKEMSSISILDTTQQACPEIKDYNIKLM